MVGLFCRQVTMKLLVLAVMLMASAAYAADAGVPAVVGIWRVDMDGVTTVSTTPSTTAPTTTTTTAPTTTTTTKPTTPSTTAPTTTTTTAPTTTTTTSPTTTTTTAPTTTTTTAPTTTTTTAPTTPSTTTPTTTTTTAPTTTTTTTPVPSPSTTTPVPSPSTTTPVPAPPQNEVQRSHPHFPQVILHREKRAGEMVHTNVFICTGTMVNENYVLTTLACAEAAASDMGTKVSAGVDTASPTTPDKNMIPVVKASKKSPLALLEVKQTIMKKPLHWTDGSTPVNTACDFVYWKQNDATKVITQMSKPMTTVACATGVTHRICVKDTPVPATTTPKPTRADTCPNYEGGVLICKEKVVAMYGKYNEAGCKDDLTQVALYEVFQQDYWLGVTAGASTVTLSALIGLVAVAVCNLFN